MFALSAHLHAAEQTEEEKGEVEGQDRRQTEGEKEREWGEREVNRKDD